MLLFSLLYPFIISVGKRKPMLIALHGNRVYITKYSGALKAVNIDKVADRTITSLEFINNKNGFSIMVDGQFWCMRDSLGEVFLCNNRRYAVTWQLYVVNGVNYISNGHGCLKLYEKDGNEYTLAVSKCINKPSYHWDIINVGTDKNGQGQVDVLVDEPSVATVIEEEKRVVPLSEYIETRSDANKSFEKDESRKSVFGEMIDTLDVDDKGSQRSNRYRSTTSDDIAGRYTAVESEIVPDHHVSMIDNPSHRKIKYEIDASNDSNEIHLLAAKERSARPKRKKKKYVYEAPVDDEISEEYVVEPIRRKRKTIKEIENDSIDDSSVHMDSQNTNTSAISDRATSSIKSTDQSNGSQTQNAYMDVQGTATSNDNNQSYDINMNSQNSTAINNGSDQSYNANMASQNNTRDNISNQSYNTRKDVQGNNQSYNTNMISQNNTRDNISNQSYSTRTNMQGNGNNQSYNTNMTSQTSISTNNGSNPAYSTSTSTQSSRTVSANGDRNGWKKIMDSLPNDSSVNTFNNDREKAKNLKSFIEKNEVLFSDNYPNDSYTINTGFINSINKGLVDKWKTQFKPCKGLLCEEHVSDDDVNIDDILNHKYDDDIKRMSSIPMYICGLDKNKQSNIPNIEFC